MWLHVAFHQLSNILAKFYILPENYVNSWSVLRLLICSHGIDYMLTKRVSVCQVVGFQLTGTFTVEKWQQKTIWFMFSWQNPALYSFTYFIVNSFGILPYKIHWYNFLNLRRFQPLYLCNRGCDIKQYTDWSTLHEQNYHWLHMGVLCITA